jgi:hypothetical protein
MHRGRSTYYHISTCIHAQCREDAAHGTPKRQEVRKERRRIDQQHERKNKKKSIRNKQHRSQTPNNDIQQSLKVRIDDCTSALECLDDAIIIIAGSEDTNNNLRRKILYQRSKALVVALWGSGRENGSGPSDNTASSGSDTRAIHFFDIKAYCLL